MENNNEFIVELTDENGEKVKVEIVEHFVDNGKDYVVANDLSNETDAYILEVRTIGDKEELVSVDSEEEFNRLCDVLDKLEDEEK